MPQKHFRKISEIDKIKNGYLIHFTDAKENKDSENRLKIGSIARQTDHLRDYSNNLLGVFETSHIYLQINSKSKKGYFIDLWEPETNVYTPRFPDDFNLNNDRGYFFFKISDFHNKIINYQDESKVSARCVVMHTPTNSNFWHISLRWFCGDEDVINWKQGKRRRLLTAAKSLIQENAIFDEPFYKEWDESIYS